VEKFFLMVGIIMTLFSLTSAYDGLVVGPANDYRADVVAYLTSLGYSVNTATSFPSSVPNYDFVVNSGVVGSSQASTFLGYLNSGKGLLLQGGDPYFLGMPSWIGMSTYTNEFGTNREIVASYNYPLGAPGVLQGDLFYHRTTYMDGGAVLTNPTTATIDGNFTSGSGRAGCIHNSYGTGRLGWVSTFECPYDLGPDGYTTADYASYLGALYQWLDGNGFNPVEPISVGLIKSSYR